MKKYEITEMVYHYMYGLTIVTERTITTTATYDEVIALAIRDNADLNEFKRELEDLGMAKLPNYFVYGNPC